MDGCVCMVLIFCTHSLCTFSTNTSWCTLSVQNMYCELSFSFCSALATPSKGVGSLYSFLCCLLYVELRVHKARRIEPRRALFAC